MVCRHALTSWCAVPGQFYRALTGIQTSRSRDIQIPLQALQQAATIQIAEAESGRQCAEALRAQPLAQARIVCQAIADPADPADPNDPRRLVLLGQLY